MMDGAEFVRGNQKNSIRIPCDELVLSGHEYQMCRYNRLRSILTFSHRNVNGEAYIYFEISGMQSLDIFFQTRKCKRPEVLMLAGGMIRLCKEISEYALTLESVVLEPKYIMLDHAEENIRFLYHFQRKGSVYEGMEILLECCIEHLDYKDDDLTKQLYQVYDSLLAQKENFSVLAEMEVLEKALTAAPDDEEILQPNACQKEASEEEVYQIKEKDIDLSIGISESGTMPESGTEASDVVMKGYKKSKRGLMLLLAADMAALLLWQPISILKLAFYVSFGVVFLGLLFYTMKKEKREKLQHKENEEQNMYMAEYAALQEECGETQDGTQIISVEEMSGVLYNLQNTEPQYIYIGETEKLIGTDVQRVQICIAQEGISRIHARVVKENGGCVIEDLNSTNGTWINGKALKPRTGYVLKEGDKVRFAYLEYIFR